MSRDSVFKLELFCGVPRQSESGDGALDQFCVRSPTVKGRHLCDQPLTSFELHSELALPLRSGF
jgi:hypothetical protein